MIDEQIEENQVQRIKLRVVSTTDNRQAGINHKRSLKYPHVTWGALRYPECAVVGGGPSLERSLPVLREWQGDIFAINDTAKYLSDNGIHCYIYAIDGTTIPYRIGMLVKGALFATRVHKIQFAQMKGREIRVFTMAEEGPGIAGGPTAACRTPHLLLSMGYRGITYFGLDGSFEGDTTHISGKSLSAHDNMLIIRVNDIDYVSHSGFMLQNEWMVEAFNKYPEFLHNASGGLFTAMLENPYTWSVIAIAEDLKRKYEEKGSYIWTKPYRGGYTWQPQAT